MRGGVNNLVMKVTFIFFYLSADKCDYNSQSSKPNKSKKLWKE